MMKSNRRIFLKNLGIGSGALVVHPALGSIATNDAVINKEASIDSDKLDNVYAQREMKADILVAGGGMSGFCTALSAARNGLKVILIQNRSRLGGNASSEIRMHICGSSELKQVWRETGILEEVMLTESYNNPQLSWEMFDYVLYDKILSNPNITMLFDTSLFEVYKSKRSISHIKAFCSQTEEVYTIKAKYFADCTGDGTLAALAGADFMRGREAKSEYNESLGLEKGDDTLMGNSLLLCATKHDKPMPFKAPDWARKYSFEDFKFRGISSYEYGYWWIELGGGEDILNDGQKIRHDLMSVLFGVWDYIKNSGNHPESEFWALSWTGAIPGKRESRRIKGAYVLTQNDIMKQTEFEDRVTYGGWSLDDHPYTGMNDTSIRPSRQIALKGPYSIPLRTLYSNSFDNLVMAGRNISVTHVALSSTRIMATCAALGQAIGTAVAYAVNNKISVSGIVANKNRLADFQQLLLRQDQPILGVKNNDHKDLARQADVQTSSETETGKAANVIDGVNRDIQDGSTHQWRADLSNGEQYIQLDWKKAVSIKTLELTFDTGLNRHLRLSARHAVIKNQVRGAQPETVSDYRIEFYKANKLIKKIEFEDNFLRKVCHEFEPVLANRVRIVAVKTHGDKYARVFEIRCYS